MSRHGFETAIALSKSYKAYKVEALDSKGKLLKTSKLFPIRCLKSSRMS